MSMARVPIARCLFEIGFAARTETYESAVGKYNTGCAGNVADSKREGSVRQRRTRQPRRVRLAVFRVSVWGCRANDARRGLRTLTIPYLNGLSSKGQPFVPHLRRGFRTRRQARSPSAKINCLLVPAAGKKPRERNG
jgi:hypothetical protein